MKKAKQLLALLLVLASIFSITLLTGCSNDDNSDGTLDDSGDDNSMDEGEKKEHNDYIDTIGGVSETYVGSVSEEEFDTSDKAATAFVEKEIAGEQTVSVVNTVSKGDLNNKEIKALNIPDEVSDGMLAVEEIEVEYQVEENTVQSGRISPVGTLNTTKKVKVYIIKYENCFKYYTPCPITGETINKSYYDSVFNAEKYKNCTYTTTMTISGTATATSGEGVMDYSMLIKQKMLYTENAIYLEMISSTSMLDETSDSKTYVYVVKEESDIAGEEDSFKCYISLDGFEWMTTSLSMVGFRSLEELSPFYDQYLDYTYFTKTDFGFELSDENAQQYINETFNGTLDLDEYQSFNMDMFCKYYVSNGVLSGMRLDSNINFTITDSSLSDSAVGKFKIVCENTVTNYGTTVVEKPFD